MMPAQVVDQRGTPGPLLLQPLHLVGAAVRVVEDPFRVLVERREIARPRVREAPHRDPAHAIGSFRVLVLPRDVVARAGGQHLDLVLLGEPLGDEAAVVLGSAEDLGAVALDDESEFHES